MTIGTTRLLFVEEGISPSISGIASNSRESSSSEEVTPTGTLFKSFFELATTAYAKAAAARYLGCISAEDEVMALHCLIVEKD